VPWVRPWTAPAEPDPPTPHTSSSSISPAGRRIAFADGRAPEALDDDTASVVAAIARADALVLATPVYRGSLTGALRNVLDHVPVPALRGTPVGIVAMGAAITTTWAWSATAPAAAPPLGRAA
jgi:hypothetical protein